MTKNVSADFKHVDYVPYEFSTVKLLYIARGHNPSSNCVSTKTSLATTIRTTLKYFAGVIIAYSQEITKFLSLTLSCHISWLLHDFLHCFFVIPSSPPEGFSSHHIKSGNVSASIVITNPLEAKLLDLYWIPACFSFFLYLLTSHSREDRHMLSYQFCFSSLSVGHSLHLICLKLQ